MKTFSEAHAVAYPVGLMHHNGNAALGKTRARDRETMQTGDNSMLHVYCVFSAWVRKHNVALRYGNSTSDGGMLPLRL